MVAADNYTHQLVPPEGDLYKSLFENSPLSMWIYDLDTLRFLEVNDAAIHRYGYSRSEFLEMTTNDLRPTEGNDGSAKQVDEGPVIKKWRGWRHRLKSGEIIEVEITTQGLKYNGRRAAFVIISNVQEQHEQQHPAEEDDERFRLIFENSDSAMILCDSDSGAITDANPVAASFFGYEKEHLCSLNIADLVPVAAGSESPSIKELLSKSTGSKVAVDYRNANGETAAAEIEWMKVVAGEKKLLHLIFSEAASEPVKNETDSAAGDDGLALVEISPQGYYRIAGDGSFVNVNKTFADMLGYTKEELLSGNVAGSIYIDAPVPGKPSDGASSNGQPEVHKMRKKDGAEIQVEDYARYSYGSGGEIAYREGFCREITPAKSVPAEKDAAREILEGLAEPVLFVRKSDGKVIDANEAAESAYGFSREELLEKHMRDISAADMPESVKRKLAAAGGEHFTFEAMHRRKNGSVFPVETVLQRIDLEGEPVLVSISRDCTERKHVEAELKKNEEKYRAIFEKSPMGILYFDTEGVITDCNDSLATIMGSTRKAVTGLRLLDLPSKELVTAVRRVLDGKVGVYEGKYRSITASKTIHVRTTFAPVSSVGGRPVGGIGIFEDITEREKAEAALKESETRYRLLYENSPVPYNLLDPTGKISDVNASWVELLGYTKREAVGKDFTVFVAPEHVDLLKEKLAAFRSSGSLGNLELDMVDKHGQRITAAVEGKVVVDANNELQQMQLMLYDITERKLAENALKESEQKFKSLAESASSAIFMYQKDRICYVNAACSALTGYSEEELLKMNFWDVVHPDFKDLVKELGVARQKGEAVPSHFELKLRARSGEGKWVDFTAATAQYKGNLAVLGTVYDVTERKNARKKLEENEEQQRLLLEKSQEAIMVFTDGKLVYVNPSGVELMHAESSDSLLGNSLTEMFHPDSRTEITDSLDEVDKKSGPVELHNTKVLDLDGSSFEVDAVMSPMTYREKPSVQIIVKREAGPVSDRREDPLKEMALDLAVNAILVTGRDFKIIWANRAFASLSGYSVSEVLDSDAFKLIGSDENGEAFFDGIKESLASGNAWKGEITSRKKDGAPYSEELVITPVTDEAGAITHFVWSKQDNTMRKSFEEQLLKSKKLEGVGQLVGTVIHDYNNVLAVVLGYGEVLKRNIADGDAVRMAAEAILSTTRRGADLTKQLLDFEHEGVVSPRAVDVNKAIESMEGLLKKAVGESLRIEFTPLRELWNAKVDPIHLYEILLNLATNARDAITGDSGTLEIKTSNVEVDGNFSNKHEGMSPGEHIMISISDTGRGMDSDLQERIFEPFFTTKQKEHAPGLGLAAVYGMLKRNGGGITVRSTPGEGATFCVYLPRFDGETLEPPQNVVIPAGSLQSNEETILLVEDHADLLGLVKLNLEEYGYKVMAALGPAEAMDICEGYPNNIDMVLVDVMLPGINGKELSEKIAGMRPGIKTLFMSGYSPATLMHEGIMIEEAAFLQKPFTADELAVRLRQALHHQAQAAGKAIM